MLLKVVGLGTGVGQQAVSSLKTRLLALQVMEMVVCGPGEEGFGDLSKCVEVSGSCRENGRGRGVGDVKENVGWYGRELGGAIILRKVGVGWWEAVRGDMRWIKGSL